MRNELKKDSETFARVQVPHAHSIRATREQLTKPQS